MKDLDARFIRRLSWLVAGSLLFFAVVAVFRVGIDALSYDAVDGAGHQAGFNDPLYWQHYLLIVENCRISRFFTREYRYDWVLLGVQLAGLGLLLGGNRVPARLTRWFFALQPIVFFWGIPLLPAVLIAVVTSVWPSGGFDREFWVDSPAILLLAAPIWTLVSLLVTWKMHGEWLGLRRLARWIWTRLRRFPAKRKPLGADSTEGFKRVESRGLA